MRNTAVHLIAIIAVLSGCSEGKEITSSEKPWRQDGDVIDSLVPMDRLIARFQESTVKADSLTGQAHSVDEFARQFLAAVAAGDTVRLGSLRVDAGEFAWLVAPQHLYVTPPYELDPALLWLQISAGSDKGQRRLIDRIGNRELALDEISCRRDTLQFPEGGIEAWSDCRVSWRSGTQQNRGTLFGTLIARNGVVKVLGYSNDY